MFTVPSFYNPLNVDVRIENVVYPRVEQVSPTTKKKKKGVCTAVECFIRRQGPPLTPPPLTSPLLHFSFLTIVGPLPPPSLALFDSPSLGGCTKC